ncbi:MAG: RnfABCDGE type electron transport complex subunit D [Alphaproteobacteria bacterium]|nr:RnfABCDGE type electron transport complex subunit D [Alphaproteobacteria bacterium]
MIKELFQDARHFQILILSSLLALLILWSDFAPEPHIILSVIATTLITQFIFYKIFKIKSRDYRSPFITSLSLCLLFKGSFLWLYPLAVVLAIGSKFLVRYNGKHIFNPANAGIVLCLLLLPDQVWVSPGQWGSVIWLGFVLICLAALVLSRAQRADIALFFLGAWFFLLLVRALWLGDPLSIPIHNAQSGALLIFAFFMISDPMTTPDHRLGRLLFACVVAILAFVLQYVFQLREAIFFALFFVCLSTPFIDMIFESDQYQWRKT